MLLPFQGANTPRLALPRVSSHLVRLALGCVLMAFQAVFSSFISNLSRDTSLPFQAAPFPTFQIGRTAILAPTHCGRWH